MAGPFLTEIQDCLLSLADKLDARLCGPNVGFAANSLTSSKVPRAILLLSSPVDLRLRYPGDDIAVTCFAENTATTFWQFVAEVNEDEVLEAKAKRWSSYEAGEFESYPILTLSNKSRILLSFCRRPAQLKSDDLTSDAFPVPSGYGFTLRTIARHNDMKDALRAFELLQARGQSIIEVYYNLLTWAKAAKLMTKSWPLTSPKHMLWMLLALPENDCSVTEFFRRYSEPENISAVKTYTQRPPHQLTVSEIHLLAEQVQHVRGSPDLLYQNTSQYFEWFVAGFRHYFVLTAEIHDARAAHSFDKAVSETIEKIRNRLAQDADTLCRVWPERLQKYKANSSHFAMIIGFTEAAADGGDGSSSSLYDLADLQLDQESAMFMIRVTMRPLTSEGIRSLNLYLSSASTYEHAATYEHKGIPLPPDMTTIRLKAPTRFRSARHIISRLRHDPEHRMTSYEVGYLDRFEGLKWKPIDEFSKPTEDEDFIPEHRVKQVRRTEDKAVIWDRATKTDDSDRAWHYLY